MRDFTSKAVGGSMKSTVGENSMSVIRWFKEHHVSKLSIHHIMWICEKNSDVTENRHFGCDLVVLDYKKISRTN